MHVTLTDRTITVADTTGMIINYTGFTTKCDGYKACARFISAIDGNVVTFSKPLCDDILAGAFPFQTMKVRPFSKPGAWDWDQTVAGWSLYIKSVAVWAQTALGTVGQKDVGFDMEVINTTPPPLPPAAAAARSHAHAHPVRIYA
jgi:hypothetical protein